VFGDHLCSDSELKAARATTSSTTSAAAIPTPATATSSDSTSTPTTTTITTTTTISSPSPRQRSKPRPATPSVTQVAHNAPSVAGPTSAPANGYAVAITSTKADHTSDIPGYGGTPTIGVALSTRCKEPETEPLGVTWDVSSGNGLTDDTIASCYGGSLSIDGPLGVQLTGRGTQVLTFTPGDINKRSLARMRLAVHVC